jgi:hypothetical protein
MNGEITTGLSRDCGDFCRVDVDEATLAAAVLEANYAGDLGEEGIVFAATDIGAGFVGCPALADDDAAAQDALAAEDLDAESLGV